MYAAHTLEGALVYAHQVVHQPSQSKQWFCPHCRQKVTLKTSSKGKAYFSHTGPCNPGPEQIKRTTKESEVHLAAKKLLANALTKSDYEISLEYYIEAIQQTADVVVFDAGSVNVSQIIEFQRSPITPQLIAKRQRAYLKHAKRCIWLVDYDIFTQGKIQIWHQTMLQYSKENGFYWFSLNLNKQQIVIKHHAPLLFQPFRLHIQEALVCLKNPSCQWLTFTDRTFEDTNDYGKLKKKTDVSDFSYQKRVHQLRRQAVYQRDFQEMYRRGHLLHSLPPWILTERWQFLITKTPGWLVFAWGYFTLTEITSCSFTTNQYSKKLLDLLTCNILQLAKMPLIEEDMTLRLAEVMLAKFKEKNHVIHCGKDEWQVLETKTQNRI